MVSFSIVQVNFHDMSQVREPLSVLIKVDNLHGTEKYHGWTKEIIDEIGISLDDAIAEFLSYLLIGHDNSLTSKLNNIQLIGVNIYNYVLPILKKYLDAYEVNLPFSKNHIDLSGACKILLNTDYFDDTLDVLGLQMNRVRHSGVKMDGMIAVVNTLRNLVMDPLLHGK
jgi:hypothetical protein